MKKIYLHMGFHKTASSSFQSTCAANLEQLASQGYLYPAFNYRGLRNGRDFYNHSGPIFSAFTEKPDTYGFNIKENIKDISQANKEYIRQLDSFITSDQDLIISGEGISGLSENSLLKLYQYLLTNCSQVIPVAVIRSPYEFHCSSAQTVVKHGRNIDLSRLRSQKETVLKINRVFEDQINYIPFSTACMHPQGPVAYLLEHCGVNTKQITFVTKNERRSNEYVRLQNALNKQQPLVVNNKLNKKHFKIYEAEGNKFLLNDTELGIMIKKLEKENHFFQNNLGNEFCDREFPTSRTITAEDLITAYPDLYYNRVNKYLYSSGGSKVKNIFRKLLKSIL